MDMRDFPIMLSTRLLTTASGFIATLLLVRGLTQSDYGTFVFWISIISFGEVISDLSLKPFYKHKIPKMDGTALASIIQKGIVVKALLGLCGTAMVIMYFRITQSTQIELLFVMGLAFLFTSLYDYFIGVLTGLKKFGEIAGAEITNSVLKLALYGIVAVFAARPIIFLGGYTAAYVAGLIIASIFLYWTIQQSEKPIKKVQWGTIWTDFRSFAPYQTLNSLIKTVGGPVLVWILVTLIGPVAVAQWNVALQFQRLLMRLMHPIREVLFPEVAASTEKQITEIVYNYIRVCQLFLVPMMAGGLVLSPQLLGIIFGTEYVESVTTFRFVLVSAIFGALSGIPYFTARGKTRQGLFYSVLNRGMTLILFTAGALVSLDAAALGYLLAISISTSVLYAAILRGRETALLARFTPWKSLFAVLTMTMVTLVLRPYVSNIVSLLLVVAIPGFVYFGLVFRGRMITREERLRLLESLPAGRIKCLLRAIIVPKDA